MNDREKTREELIAELAQLRRQVAEESALPELRRAAALFQVAPLAIHECDTEGRCTFVNPSQEAITGFTASELVGAYLWDRIAPGPEKDSLPAHLKKLVAEQPAPTPFFAKNIKKSGEVFDARVDWNYIRNANAEITGFVSVVSDITPQKQAELDLRKANAQLEQRVKERTADLQESNEELRLFKTFAEASGEGFGMSDMDHRIVYGNAALARLVGASKPEDAYGKHPSIYYSDDYQELLATEIFPVLERNGSWQDELTMVSVTGERIPVLQTSFTLVDKDGEAVRRGVVITDLRKIKKAEESLQNSLRELQAIYDGMLDGFSIYDMDKREAVRVNSALCNMMGYTEEELKALPVEKMHPQEDFPWILKRAQAHAAGCVSRTESIPMLRRDGSVFYTDVSSNPINYNGRRCIISFLHDVTDRKRSEEELERSEARYKALVESSPDAVVMCDLEGRITFASPQAAERHGVEDASDLIGQTAMDLVVEQERKTMQLNIRRLLESGIRRNDQYTGLRMDGTTFFGELSASVITGISGEAESFVAVYRDITERKLAQESLRRMLRASDRERELITYDIHDGVAQQLLGSLMHFEAVLQLNGGVAQEAMPSFETGLMALRKASAEARSLMNRTRTPVLQKFGIRSAITEFIDQFMDRPNAPEITYHCEARFGRLEPVLESTIFRVAQESITNACIHSNSEIVRVTLIQKNDEVTIEVQDSGIGFDVAHEEENRFGLHGIRERVRLLGKKLKIESKPGKGTLVRATFPLIYRDEQAD